MKHYFNKWRQTREDLGGLAKVAIAPTESHSECRRCGVKVKVGSKGGTKFWVNGKWTSKRPPCLTK